LLAELFDRVQSAAGNRRDPEAEAFIAEKVRAQPYAPYLLAQAVIVQEEGLKNALARIEQLEREAADAKAQPAGGGSFLGSIFGGGQRAAEQSQPAPGPWSHQRSSVPSVGPQTGGWGGQQMQQPQQAMQQPQGGSFLKGALGAAAGVAGGVLLANSLQGLFSGGNNAHGIAGDTASAGAASASSANSDITGGIFDSKPAAAPTPAAEPVSYDDGGSSWDSGDDGGSFDA
jgi:hypothetical protein